MRKVIKMPYLIMTLMISSLLGCGAAHIRTETETVNLDRYTNVAINEVKISSVDKASEDNVELQKKLDSWKKFARAELESYAESSKFNLVEASDSYTVNTLVIDLEISVQYGSRALRYFAGFGAGQGGVESTITIRDSNTSEVKYQSNAKSDLSVGAFGGDIGGVLKKNIKTLVDTFRASQGNYLTGGVE